jgi:hypothetical protein
VAKTKSWVDLLRGVILLLAGLTSVAKWMLAPRTKKLGARRHVPDRDLPTTTSPLEIAPNRRDPGPPANERGFTQR